MVDFAKFKKIILYGLIGSLIVSALVAVVTVLTGDFNNTAANVLWTLFMVVVHALASLLFIWDDEKQNTFQKMAFVTNVIFTLIVASFITSIFNVWDIIPVETIIHMYQTYFSVFLASLYINFLSKAKGKENYMDMLVDSNYFIIFILFAMFQLVIYVNNAAQVLGEPFFRVFGATAIIDGTLSILIIIFYKLYINKHPVIKTIPEVQAGQPVQPAQPEQSSGLSA
jgi:hypothetical protein